ncbi:hypothetical protein MBLNU230_g2740t1 [Neophaeotheca triangularis]
MRRSLLLSLLLILALIIFLTHQVWTLITLLFVDGHDSAIHRSELPTYPPSNDAQNQTDPRPQLIPKILHQTYINTSIPQVWAEAQQSCLNLHPQHPSSLNPSTNANTTSPDGEWEYKLWTDAASAAFIRKEYPWFAHTFENYPYPIQRADAIRYFVLAHYGGVYIDLDDGCNRPLEPLLTYSAWLRRTDPTGISNDAMGSVPGHPFFLRVIKTLQFADRNWLVPYLTVMASTGPLFLSVIWRRWSMEGFNHGEGLDGSRLRVLMPAEYNDFPWSFFTHHRGNSWHGGDVQFFIWVAHHWLPLTLLLLLLLALTSLTIYSLWTRHLSPHTSHQRSVSLTPSSSPPPMKWKTPPSSPFWRRLSASKILGLAGLSKGGRYREYELVERHEV